MSALYARHKVWFWAAAWLLTRALIVVQVGFWHHTTGVNAEDVRLYSEWSEQLAHDHTLPAGQFWQYPPGAAFVLLLPRLGLFAQGYLSCFVATMLAFDLVCLMLIALLARREGRDAGVWVWLLAMPMLRAIPVLRFDPAATAAAIGALAVIHRRPAWFGALAGLGATVKVWPLAVLFGEWEWRRLLRSCLAAGVAVALVFALGKIAFHGDPLEFLQEQGGRGLQDEAVAATPWHLRQLVTGEKPFAYPRYGSNEIASDPADVTADLLEWVSLAVLIGIAAWWAARARAIRAGRDDLKDPVVSRDFVFTAVLLLVIASRVLSPQYMVWLFGLAAVSLTEARTRVARPAWIAIGAAILTTAPYGPMGAWGEMPIYGSPFNLVVRNAALLFAAADAAVAMVALLRRPAAGARLAVASGERRSAAAAPARTPP